VGEDAEITTGGLLERDTELDAIDSALVRASRGAGSLVVIDGAAGVGKTALLARAHRAAIDTGLTPLRARGAEIERTFAFGVARQLFEPIVRDPRMGPKVDLFAGAARFAAALLGVEREADSPDPPRDPFALRHALYWLTANLAALRPIAILVDDAHWADAASLAALAHIAHRLEGMPVGLIVASRSEESFGELDSIRVEAGDHGVELRVAPLGPEAAAAVVRSFAPSADDALCRSCYRASGGNPFLLHELARSLFSERSGSPDLRKISDHSPVTVTREVAARLGRLPDAAARLAGAAAILGTDVPLRQAAALAEIDQAEAVEAADTLIGASVLRSAQPLEFLHPLVRAAVYDGLGPAARSTEHGRAARLLSEEGASPERVAAQLLRCHPAGEEWVCDQLLAAARLAFARGAAAAAASYLRRALDEPPPPGMRAQVLPELGAAESMAFDPESAIAHLREALAADLDAEQRLHATMLLCGLLGHLYRLDEAADVLEEQLELLAARPDLQTTAEVALTNVTRVNPLTRPRGLPAIERLRKRVNDGTESDPSVLGTIATEMVMAGDPADRTADLAERALVGFAAKGTGAADWSGYNALRSLVMSERYEAALRALERADRAARERGVVIEVASILAFRAELYLRVGELASAEVDARTLNEIATALGWTGGQGFATAWLGEALVERGELDEAERLLEHDETATEALARGYSAAEVLLARGRLRLAQGRVTEAVDDMRGAGRWSIATGNVNPAASGWRCELAHALLDLDQTNEARRLAADDLERARRFGAPRALANSLRLSARVEGGQEEIRMLREAAGVLERSPARLERARVHAALGAALRQAGNPTGAQETLRSAVDLAHRCGARPLEDQAFEELRATGARPRRRHATGADALTPSERRIAELAAGGRQNREIAQALFVTTNTVEFHLRNAYRKLEITSRTQLGDALRPSNGGDQNS
jgi:DNA-binding CsgD family transcriptional regulator